MENKINITEILKDCPQGMELYSPIYGLGKLTKVTDRIHVKFPKEHNVKCFRHDGKVSDDGEIMLFPKGKTTWEEFVPSCEFKDGDVVFYNDTIAIFKEWSDETLFRTYVTKYLCCDSLIDINVPLFGKSIRKEIRLATEEEKQKLFDAIKENGYKWNEETKTLEKLVEPKFKVGDKVQWKEDIREKRIIDNVLNNCYTVQGYGVILFDDQDEWELAPNKFDITTLKPFNKVLVRHNIDDKWKASLFSCIDEGVNSYSYKFITVADRSYPMMIPYEGNEHLYDTTNDCDEYYKTWE